VTCIACHAPGQAKIGRSEIDGEWGIVHAEPEAGATLAYSALSHQVELQVDCARCHYAENPWGLQLVSGQELVK